MNTNSRPLSIVLCLVFLILSSVGCSTKDQPENPHLQAIQAIRQTLDLPDSALEYIENTFMVNSPSGSLEVANYRDGEGRIYSVSLQTNQVVEIDARATLENIPADAPALPQEEIKATALEFAKAVIPDFETLQSSLQFEEGGKVDNYFFTWYREIAPGDLNRPFLQFGFHKSGLLFAYYNTLLLSE